MQEWVLVWRRGKGFFREKVASQSRAHWLRDELINITIL